MIDARELWTPDLGHVFSLRPCDMADLTMNQLGQMTEALEDMKRGS